MAQDYLEDARRSLARIQDFSSDDLDRQNELGTELNFREMIPDAQRLVELFNLIPQNVLDDLSGKRLATLRAQADQVYRLLQDAIEFTVSDANPAQTRANIISRAREQYDEVFEDLFPLISYASARSADFGRLERNARAAVQKIEDQTVALSKDIEKSRDDASSILQDIRKTAAEHGVSQQSIYFRDESDEHAREAEIWRKNTLGWASALFGLAGVSLLLHKIPFLQPTDNYDAVQMVASKVLAFGAVSYMMFLSARNYLSHRHNAVVNKHRQNSLATFRALVDAGGTREARDIVLKFAASSVFSPQDTGYVKSYQDHGLTSNMLVELSSRASETVSSDTTS